MPPDFRIWAAWQADAQNAEQIESHHHSEKGYKRRDQGGHLPIDAPEQSTQTAQQNEGSNDSPAERQAALPRGTIVFKAGEIGECDWKERERTRPQAGEDACPEDQGQSERPWLSQRTIQQLLAALSQIREQQQVQDVGAMKRLEPIELGGWIRLWLFPSHR